MMTTATTCHGLDPNPPAAHEARYKLLSGENIGRTGTFTISDITDSGILLAGQHQLAPGQLLELSIRWPALELVARGQVMHAAQGEALFCFGQPVQRVNAG